MNPPPNDLQKLRKASLDLGLSCFKHLQSLEFTRHRPQSCCSPDSHSSRAGQQQLAQLHLNPSPVDEGTSRGGYKGKYVIKMSDRTCFRSSLKCNLVYLWKAQPPSEDHTERQIWQKVNMIYGVPPQPITEHPCRMHRARNRCRAMNVVGTKSMFTATLWNHMMNTSLLELSYPSGMRKKIYTQLGCLTYTQNLQTTDSRVGACD